MFRFSICLFSQKGSFMDIGKFEYELELINKKNKKSNLKWFF